MLRVSTTNGLSFSRSPVDALLRSLLRSRYLPTTPHHAKDARPPVTTALSTAERPAPDALARPAFLRAAAFAILLAVVLRTVYLLHAAWAFDTDDAFITLRYARHLAEGHGIVWNVGENPPVEGYSNFTFVVLGAAALRAGLDPILVFKLLCSLALLVSVGLMYGLARRWTGPVGATLPPLLFTAYAGTIWWTVSGLETAFYLMLALGAAAAFVRAFRADDAAPWSLPWLAGAGVLVFLAGLTRPEGPLLGMALGAALVADVVRRVFRARAVPGGPSRALRHGLRAAFALALAFALPYGLYFGWRLGHFGRLLPNTVYCKTGYVGDPFTLLRAFLTWTWPFALLAVFALRRFDPRLWAAALVVVLYGIALFGADPIIAYWNRHFLTAGAFLVLLGVIGGFRLLRRLFPKTPPAVAELAAVLLFSVVTTGFLPNVRDAVSARARTYAARMEVREALGRSLDERLAPDETFVVGDAGMIPYVARARVIDAYCLNCGAMTRPPIDRDAARFVDYLMDERPEVIVVHSWGRDTMYPHELYGVFPELLSRPAFTEGYAHVETFGYERYNYWVYERADRLAKAP